MAFGRMGGMGRGFGRLGSPLGSVRPSWVQPGAIFDEIFTTGQYWPRPINQELVDVRASSKNLTDASGLISSVGSNILPISTAGMLVEGAATNICLRSEAFDSASWTKNAISAVADQTTAPDNTVTADKINQDATTAIHFVRQNIAIAAGSSNAAFVYAKQGEMRYVQLSYDTNDGNGGYANFDLQLGTVTQSSAIGTGTLSATLVKSVASGFFQIGVAAIGAPAGTSGRFFLGPVPAGTTPWASSVAGVAGNGIYVWGSQWVTGTSTFSSYIETTTTTAARAADAITLQRTGVGRIVFTFDDDSQQTVSGIDVGTQYSIPTNLNRPLIKRMTGYAS